MRRLSCRTPSPETPSVLSGNLYKKTKSSIARWSRAAFKETRICFQT